LYVVPKNESDACDFEDRARERGGFCLVCLQDNDCYNWV